MSNFVINGFAFPLPPVHRDDENLYIFAPRYLNNFYSENPMFWDENSLNSKMECLMFALPYVAEYYNLDKNDILKEWLKQYGIYQIDDAEEIKYTHRFSTPVDIKTGNTIDVTTSHESQKELYEYLTFTERLSKRASAFGKRFFNKAQSLLKG